MNNLGGVYTTGTITIAVGGVSVTGVGTLWTPIAEIGDWILCNGQVGLILTVNGDTLLTLQTPWQGTLPSGATYVLIKMSWLRYEPALMQAKLRELLAELEGAGNFIFTSVDPPDPALGQDGDFALKADVTPWQIWVKTGGVWVEQAPPGAVIVDDQVTPPMLDADTTAKQEAFRVRLYAAPFDALAYNGMQVNGSMEVDQANSGAAVTVSGVTRSADGFSAQAAHASAVFQVQQVTCGVTGFAKMIRLFATTGGNVGSTAGDLARITTNIEGYRVSRLNFGVASGIGFTVSFWIQSTIGGTLCLAVLNRNPSDRSYITEFTVAASAWEYKTIFVPADTTGAWDNTYGLGISISIVSRCGSTFQGSVGWQAGLKLCTAATTNFFATTNNAIYITGFLVLPGTQTPTLAQSSLIMRPYDQELVTCKRYYEKMTMPVVNGTFGPAFASQTILARAPIMFLSKRTLPTVTTSTATDFVFSSVNNMTASAITSTNVTYENVLLDLTVAGATAGWGGMLRGANTNAWIAVDARL